MYRRVVLRTQPVPKKKKVAQNGSISKYQQDKMALMNNLTAIIVVGTFQKEVGKLHQRGGARRSSSTRSTRSTRATGRHFKHGATFQDGRQRHVFGGPRNGDPGPLQLAGLGDKGHA